MEELLNVLGLSNFSTRVNSDTVVNIELEGGIDQLGNLNSLLAKLDTADLDESVVSESSITITYIYEDSGSGNEYKIGLSGNLEENSAILKINKK